MLFLSQLWAVSSRNKRDDGSGISGPREEQPEHRITQLRKRKKNLRWRRIRERAWLKANSENTGLRIKPKMRSDLTPKSEYLRYQAQNTRITPLNKLGEVLRDYWDQDLKIEADRQMHHLRDSCQRGLVSRLGDCGSEGALPGIGGQSAAGWSNEWASHFEKQGKYHRSENIQIYWKFWSIVTLSHSLLSSLMIKLQRKQVSKPTELRSIELTKEESL